MKIPSLYWLFPLAIFSFIGCEWFQNPFYGARSCSHAYIQGEMTIKELRRDCSGLKRDYLLKKTLEYIDSHRGEFATEDDYLNVRQKTENEINAAFKE